MNLENSYIITNFNAMPKKISVQNVVCQMLLKTDLSTLKFSLNSVGGKSNFRNINALSVVMFGIIQISSVCSIEM